MSPVHGLVRFSVKQLDRLETAITRVDATRDIEAVHALRVASRRLNEPLELIGESRGRKRCKKLIGSLRKLRNAVRDVRDMDVLMMALTGADRGHLSDAEGVAKLQGTLAIMRENKLLDARKTIRRLDPENLREKASALLKECDRGESRKRAKRLLSSSRKQWVRKAEALLERPPAREHGAGVHKVRIRLKALRYSTELMSRLDGENREALLSQFEAMQDRLGAWNDHFSAARLLTQIASDEDTSASDPLWSSQILQYAARRVRAMGDELEGILLAWPRLRAVIETHLPGRVQSEVWNAARPVAADTKFALERV